MPAGAPITTRVTLRDGRVALIAPLHPDDRQRYLGGVGQMSEESIYRRFMTPMPRLTESQLRYLLEVDHSVHEALLAVDEESGEAVGVGRFVRLEDPARAEAALIVIDPWHGFGLGKALCRVMAERAREIGIEWFEASVLGDNAAMLAVLKALGPVSRIGRDGAAAKFEVPLPLSGIGAHTTGVLRELESGEFEVVPPEPGDEAPRLESET